MPFDGTLQQQLIVKPRIVGPHTARWASTHKRTRRKLARDLSRCVISACACILLAELAYPRSGPLSLLVYGPEGVRQSIIAQKLLHHGHRLRIPMGFHTFWVINPDHDLTADEKTAWFGFARRMDYPVYSVDGSLTIDP